VGNETDPRTWLDRFVRACVSLLVAALALYLTVQVLSAIWVWLVTGLFVAVCATLAVHVIRRRLGGW
jgi:hypothetical protein